MSFPLANPSERTIFVCFQTIKIYHNNDMEQDKHNTIMRYTSPESRVVFVKAQGILCVSNPEKYSTETSEGDDNW